MPSETSRIEAFSDGVFAIAATLLILDVKIPQSNQANLAAQLGQQWPSYFAFLLRHYVDQPPPLIHSH